MIFDSSTNDDEDDDVIAHNFIPSYSSCLFLFNKAHVEFEVQPCNIGKDVLLLSI